MQYEADTCSMPQHENESAGQLTTTINTSTYFTLPLGDLIFANTTLSAGFVDLQDTLFHKPDWKTFHTPWKP
jgi:hypothetical protein